MSHKFGITSVRSRQSGKPFMRPIIALVMLLMLSACSLPVFFRVPIVQGNIVTAEQVGKLQKGMTKKQIAYVLGTPMIASPFAKDRWDYVFYYRNPHAHVRQSRLTLYFVQGRLSEFDGDDEYAMQVLKKAQKNNDDDQMPNPDAADGATEEDPVSNIEDSLDMPGQTGEEMEEKQENTQPQQMPGPAGTPQPSDDNPPGMGGAPAGGGMQQATPGMGQPGAPGG